MGVAANREAVERAVEIWNTHDERYFELYADDAPIHGFPEVPPTVEGMKALFHQM
jgi:hypothetical protein